MKNFAASLAVIVTLSSLPSSSYAAINPEKLPPGKRTTSGKYLSAKEAYKMKRKDTYNVVLIDVRTPAENEFVGIADEVDKVIPLKLNNHAVWDNKKERYGQYVNPNFITDIDALIRLKEKDKNTPLILMCRSGERSAEAATLLTKNGYTNVYSIYDGFEGDLGTDGDDKGRRTVNGWKNSKLPWGYSLKQDRAYFVVTPAPIAQPVQAILPAQSAPTTPASATQSTPISATSTAQPAATTQSVSASTPIVQPVKETTAATATAQTTQHAAEAAKAVSENHSTKAATTTP